MLYLSPFLFFFFFSSRRRHTRCALVTGVQTCALPILPVADAPIWSPDGSWIAFLRQDGGRTRLWRAAIDGSGSAPIAAVDSDARDFRFANGATIVLKLDGDVQEARANIERSEERRVGKEGVSTCNSRWSPEH